MDVENFKDYPQSITERRSDKTEAAKDWTPRDCLIALLRRIDNGERIDALVVSYADLSEGKIQHGFSASSPNGLITQGILFTTMQRCLE